MRAIAFRLVAAVAFASASAQTADAQDDGKLDWCMDGGNSARTSFVDVAPIANAPVELWRRRPDEGCICEPVVWNGVVFVVSKTSGGVQALSAIDAKSGAVLSHDVRFGHKGGDLRLAVWRNVVVVAEPYGTEGLAPAGPTFRSTWNTLVGSSTAPCVFRGVAFVANVGLDAVSGRSVLSPSGSSSDSTPLRADAFELSIASLPNDRAVMVAPQWGPHGKYAGTWLRSGARYLSRCSGGPASLAAGPQQDSVPVAEFARWDKVDLRVRAVEVRVESGVAGQPGAWIISADAQLSTPSGKSGGLAVHVDKGPIELVPGVVRPAVCGYAAYTFDAAGNLLAVRADGAYEVAAAAAELPPHDPRVRLSAARGMVYVGAWGFDVATKRVSWAHPFPDKDRVVGPAIPLGDGVVLVRTEAGELVCLADPQRPASPRPNAPPAAAKQAGPPRAPTAGDGVILRDGRQILGAVRSNGAGRIVVTPKDGEARSYSVDEILVAESQGAVLASAPEREVYRYWRDILRPEIAQRMSDAAVAASDLGLVKQSAAFVERARRWGLSEARVAELTKKLAGRADPAYPEPKLRGLERRTSELFKSCVDDLRGAAEWCGARGFAVAGGVIADAMGGIDGGAESMDAVSAKLAPTQIVEIAGQSRAGSEWRAWAKVLLEADASLIAAGDPAWARVRKAPWTERTLAFRTPNLLFFSRSVDPAVVGPCLSRGEAAVRGLRQFLKGDVPVRAADDEERLEVRLHSNRDDYLAEAGAGGGMLAFSLGYYSPRENVSRFYVPAKDAKAAESLDRGLFKVLAHELTHHYVEGRWLDSIGATSRLSTSNPGYWVVEGVARFVEDQIVDSGARGLTFEDPNVMSVTLAAQAQRIGVLMPMSRFVDMDNDGFAALDHAQNIKLTPPNSRTYYLLSETNLFYELGGTLVFFLRNARGDEGRKAFVEYLRLYYVGAMKRGSWKTLGFASAEALETEFAAWLQSLKW